MHPQSPDFSDLHAVPLFFILLAISCGLSVHLTNPLFGDVESALRSICHSKNNQLSFSKDMCR